MTMIPKPETNFLLRRAEEEAIQAIRTDHPSAADAHFELALLYGERARTALIRGIDPLREEDADRKNGWGPSGTVDTGAPST